MSLLLRDVSDVSKVIIPAGTTGCTDSDTAINVSTSMHTLKLTAWLHLGDSLVAGWL